MYFRDLQDQLIGIARFRVRSGELTERGLARLSGISQPHMHHVLNNLRLLSTEATDRLMKALDLSVPDVLWSSATEPRTGVRSIPLVRDRIGPASEGILGVIAGYYPFPERMIQGLVEPVAARLGPDLAMPKRLAVRDLVLLDQNPQLRARPAEEGALWVVQQGAGLSVRCLHATATHLHLANEATGQWQSIALAGQNILEVVRAQIVWIGREVETETAGPADPAGARYRSHR